MDGGSIRIDNHLPEQSASSTMLDEVARALTRRPKILSPRWLYDDRGSQLFDEITRLPEYYPTEAERSILQARAGDIVAMTGADSVVELGSGTSDKTRTLLDAFWAAGQLRRFVPVDVSEGTLVEAANALAARYRGVEVHALVGDFTRHLQFLPTRAGGSSPFSAERSAISTSRSDGRSWVHSPIGSNATNRSCSAST